VNSPGSGEGSVTGYCKDKNKHLSYNTKNGYIFWSSLFKVSFSRI